MGDVKYFLILLYKYLVNIKYQFIYYVKYLESSMIKHSYLKLPLIIFLGFFLTNCASIISDATQVVSVETPNCKGAKCRMTNSEGIFYIQSTPGSTAIQKAYGDLTITCEKDHFSFTSIHKSKANMATYGNILLGGIPGALIDGGSGKGYDYPTLLINGLSCRN